LAFTHLLNDVLTEIQSDLRLSPAELAMLLGTTTRTIERWRRGEALPQRQARERLEQFERLAERVRNSFTSPDGAAAWLHADSRYLGGMRPLDALRAGRLDRVEAALEALDSGVFV
jgi:hypothetical protein